MIIKNFPRTSFMYNLVSFRILAANFLCKFTKGNNGWISSSTTKEILPSTKLNKWRSSERVFTRAGKTKQLFFIEFRNLIGKRSIKKKKMNICRRKGIVHTLIAFPSSENKRKKNRKLFFAQQERKK